MLRTRRREQLLFAACLDAKQSFVIDNTNPSPEDRSRYIQPARLAGFRVAAYFFDTTLPAALHRNKQRPGKQNIPLPGIHRTFSKLQPPLLSEGFDAVYTVGISTNNDFVVSNSAEPAAS
jgi:predicted kinase